MIDRLIDICSHRSLTVITAAIAVALLGGVALTTLPVDALPEIGDRQIIVRSQWPRSPDIVDEQVTYPIATAFVGLPHVSAVRGLSDFGTSFVYVILDERADLDQARQRVVETLATVAARLPDGVKTELGPDATSLGWVFQYVLIDRMGRQSLSDLRGLQDWRLANELRSVEGVAEVATLGGFVREYQINVDPARLRAYKV
jgi:Cu(I)/Ag(I) efflux system membrane protein CusA/SilA